VLSADAAFSAVLAERTAIVTEVAPYRPGEFFVRELPPLRAVLHGVRGLSLLIVDGYVDLDPCGRPGLGAHAQFGVPGNRGGQVGLQDSYARRAGPAGHSVRPLYVTAAGMPLPDAAELVRHMAGRFRLPDALRRADTLGRTGQSPNRQSA
jgi:deoxyribonuclease V